MPLLSKIFSGVNLKDLYTNRCTQVKTIESQPFIRRCTGDKVVGLEVCKRHAVSVTYRNQSGAKRTQYFGNIETAESFRINRVPDMWIETSYTIPQN